ncbi:MAG: nitroreductase/quinone reductase family protein [Chloroflexota bacterium]
MKFDEMTLGRFRDVEEVEIETMTAHGTPRRTIIWIVADDQDAYVRSVRGDRGRWYRDVVARPAAALLPDGDRIEVQAHAAVDDASIELVSRLLRDKYGSASRASTESMLLPETLHTTLRLEPR